MSTGWVIGTGVLGVVVGLKGWIVVERLPEHRPLLARPYPELRAGMRQPLGLAVVLGTGALWAGTAARFDDGWVLVPYLVLGAALVVLSAIDLRHFILPNRVLLPLTVALLVLFGLAALANDDGDAYLRAIACGVGAFACFMVLHMISPRSMGFGDVKLSFVLGLSLGWLGVGETVLGLFLGFVYAAVIGVLLIVIHLRTRKDHVPFGPFLAAGTMTAVLVGDVILDWYRR